jgi:hypothetical protein
MSTGDLRAFVLMSVMVKKWDLQLNEEISLVEWRNTIRDLKGMKSTKTKAPHCSNTLWTNYPWNPTSSHQPTYDDGRRAKTTPRHECLMRGATVVKSENSWSRCMQ